MAVENNGPLPGSGADRLPLSRQRRGVLQYLRGQSGPVTATALAQVCALHVNTVREHLDALVDDGLVVRERSAPAGRGRPAQLYRARSPQASPAREYAGLAAVLAARIARSAADPRADALAAGEDWGRVLTAGQEPSADPGEARRRVLGLLAEIGFAPEADDEARRVRLPRCPFVETAREHPGVVCGVHEGLTRAALAALGPEPQDVDLLPFAEPDACLLHLAGGRPGPRRPPRTRPADDGPEVSDDGPGASDMGLGASGGSTRSGGATRDGGAAGADGSMGAGGAGSSSASDGSTAPGGSREPGGSTAPRGSTAPGSASAPGDPEAPHAPGEPR